MPKSKEPKTHFEQVPLEIVKQIADQEISSDEENGVRVTVEAPVKEAKSISGSGSATVKVL
jgi:hypothetical protein